MVTNMLKISYYDISHYKTSQYFVLRFVTYSPTIRMNTVLKLDIQDGISLTLECCLRLRGGGGEEPEQWLWWEETNKF